METAIRLLLKEHGKKVAAVLDSMPDQTPQAQISPETYLGSKRMQYYFPSAVSQTEPKHLICLKTRIKTVLVMEEHGQYWMNTR